MEALFKTWKTSRQLYADFFDNYSTEQLNAIPKGFNNNLIWNIGHVIIAQQALIYKGANQKVRIPERLFKLYAPGTKPTGNTSQEDIDELKSLLTSVVDQTMEDYEQGKFETYNERMTGTGFHLTTVADAFEFNNYHEGLHLGYMMSIKRFV